MARILLIDNAVGQRRRYRYELECEGYEIIDVGSGTEALEVLAREKMDAVVFDLRLPDYYGLHLLDEILSRHRHLPIVIHTAYTQFRNNFQTWGADAFVAKSADLSELKGALGQVISAHDWDPLPAAFHSPAFGNARARHMRMHSRQPDAKSHLILLLARGKLCA